jgi:hypothetical protein
MKQWRLSFTYAGTGVGQLDLVTKCLKEAKFPATFLLAKDLSPWFVISLIVRLGFPGAVFTANACGSFLNCILACATTQITARSRFVGENGTSMYYLASMPIFSGFQNPFK